MRLPLSRPPARFVTPFPLLRNYDPPPPRSLLFYLCSITPMSLWIQIGCTEEEEVESKMYEGGGASFRKQRRRRRSPARGTLLPVMLLIGGVSESGEIHQNIKTKQKKENRTRAGVLLGLCAQTLLETNYCYYPCDVVLLLLLTLNVSKFCRSKNMIVCDHSRGPRQAVMHTAYLPFLAVNYSL